MNVFIALLKREVSEHKSLWRVPLVLIGIALLVKMSFSYGNLAIDFDVPEGFNIDSTVDSMLATAIVKALGAMNYIIMLVMFLVAIFYALSSLYDERKDQSVLFWRSLPISDAQTIMAKLAVAIVLVPIIVLVLQSVAAVLFLGAQSGGYLGSYLVGAISSMGKILLWSMLPTIAWCLVCSQVANKNPFLLALVTPMLVILVDWLFLNGVLADTLVINRFSGVDTYTPVVLIIGLVFSAACLAFTIAKRGERF